MQAKAALLKSSALDVHSTKVSSEVVKVINQNNGDKKTKEKKPLKLDFSAYCDCV